MASWCATFDVMNRALTRCRMEEIESPPPVLSKADFTRRYKAGEFGNASRTWDNYGDFNRWGLSRLIAPVNIPGKFHLRSKIAGGPTHYNLTFWECDAMWYSTMDREGWYVSEMAPEHLKILQGELYDGDTGLYLNYNTLPLPMREGMARESLHAEGTKARMLLRGAMCPNSLEWVYELLRRYPGHVIEFSSYSAEWGTVPGFNTVFWEVRKY